MSHNQSGDFNSNQTPAGAVETESGDIVPAGTPVTGETVHGAPPPRSVMPGQDPYRDHPVAGVATQDAPAGGRDESIPVTDGNQHMLIGASGKDVEAKGESKDAAVGGPGTDRPNAGLTRTVGVPESAAEPIKQVGNTVILGEDNKDKDRPEFAPGLPKPRTDPDADPHEKTDPGFQGFDRINPLALPGSAEAIEHRGAVNEPRVVGVQAVGDVRVIGSESSEAKNIAAGMSPEEAQAETLYPSAPDAPASNLDTAEAVDETKRGHLPDDFPGYNALAEEGVNTYGQLRKRIDAGTLLEIPGIGQATAEKIEEAMNE